MLPLAQYRAGRVRAALFDTERVLQLAEEPTTPEEIRDALRCDVERLRDTIRSECGLGLEDVREAVLFEDDDDVQEEDDWENPEWWAGDEAAPDHH